MLIEIAGYLFDLGHPNCNFREAPAHNVLAGAPSSLQHETSSKDYTLRHWQVRSAVEVCMIAMIADLGCETLEWWRYWAGQGRYCEKFSIDCVDAV